MQTLVAGMIGWLMGTRVMMSSNRWSIVPSYYYDPFLVEQPQQAQQHNSSSVLLQDCLAQLPTWVHAGSDNFRAELWEASQGRTDKVGNPKGRKEAHSHQYQLVYYPALSHLIQRKQCLDNKVRNNNNDETTIKSLPLRFLEIGLGCNPQRVGVGGSAMAWSHMFRSLVDVELYIFEYDAGCAKAWQEENPGLVTGIITGDAGDPADLRRAMEEAGNRPFDVIIDDGSHINDHQVLGIEVLFQDWVAPGGLYVVEDIESSCYSWPANVGKPERGPATGGTQNCLQQKNGKPTILGKLLEYQKGLMHWKKKAPFGGTLTHVDIHWGAAVLEKKME